MYHFNVLTEPWIPAVDRRGAEREYGVLELLERAHDLRGVVDPAPPIQFGLYRFLVAFVQTALRIREFEDVEDVFLDGRFDVGALQAYVDQVGAYRFDLFDAQRPFMQSPPMAGESGKEKSVVELFYHLPTGTNVIHWYNRTQDEHAVAPAVAARALCSISPFMTAGGAGYSPSINGTPPWYVLALGDNLFETLLFNCCVMEIPGLDWSVPPQWEDDTPFTPRKEVSCDSLAQGYTWQPRQVRLVPSEGGVCTYSGQQTPILIRTMVWGPGHKAGSQDSWLDPNVAYERDPKRGMLSVRPREGREIWRDYGPLFLLQSSEGQAGFDRPIIVEQIQSLKEERMIPKEKAELFEVYGMRVDKAKVYEWQYERLPLATGVLLNPHAGVQVDHALHLAEEVAKGLYAAAKRLYPEDGSRNKQALSRLIVAAQTQYWERLREYFSGPYLQRLGSQRPDDEEARKELLGSWKQTVRETAWEALRGIAASMGTAADALQREIAATDYFAIFLARVLKPQKTERERRG